LSCASLTSTSVHSPSFQNSKSTAKSSTEASVSVKRFNQYSLSLMFLRISVARLLSSQKPGDSDFCLSSFILYRLFSTSKKPPQDG
jgi:hypothetical protein